MNWCFEGLWQRVLTDLEYRAVSGVFQNIGPHPLSTQRVCPPPAPKAGAYTLAGQGGGQYFGRRQTLDWLLQYNLSTVCGYHTVAVGLSGEAIEGCPNTAALLAG